MRKNVLTWKAETKKKKKDKKCRGVEIKQEAKENIKNKTIKSIPREIRDDTHSWNKEPLEIENIIARAKTLINDLEDKVELSSRKKGKKTKKMEIVERKKRKVLGHYRMSCFYLKYEKLQGKDFVCFNSMARTKPDT